jgi:uncharacterized RDD family membrane protein YckC
VYDLLIVLAILFGAVMLGLLLTGGQLLDDHQHLRARWFPFFEGACVAAYFLASWCRGGQTVGLRPWRLRVVGADGRRPPTLAVALRRLAVAAAPLALLTLGPLIGPRGAALAMLAAWVVDFGAALADRRARALHDRLAGTAIVRIG